MNVRRVGALGLVLVVITSWITGMAGPAAATTAPTPTTLRAAGAVRGLYLGSAVNYPALSTDAEYGTTLAREFSQVSPENELKWDTIHPTPTTYDFTRGDYIVNWAMKNKLVVHGHTLLWHSQNPAWLVNTAYDRVQSLAILHDHINTVVGHFRGRITAWDVANEIMGDDGTLRKNIWYQRIGPDYIDYAFQWAHEADPAVRLYLNDYGNQGRGKKSDAIYNLVADMKRRGIPIDGVGIQAHIGTYLAGSTAAMNDITFNMARLNALGLETPITEMDVALPLPSTPASLQLQATGYSGVMAACLAASNCSSFTTWGFTDKYSWIPGFEPGFGDALPMDAAFQPKPAYTALLAKLNASPGVVPSIRAANVPAAEGNAGPTVVNVPITLSVPTTKAVTVRYSTLNKAATTANGDYVATSGIVAFAPGETSKTVPITINGDTTVEPDEQFFVVISYATNATIGWAYGGVVILNDD